MSPIKEGGGVDPLPLKKSTSFKKIVKNTEHSLKNFKFFSVLSPLSKEILIKEVKIVNLAHKGVEGGWVRA